MLDILALISAVSAAVAAVAALVALYFAWKAVREGRLTTLELKKLAVEAAKETAAQESIVDSIRDLVAGSRATAQLLHAVFLETQAARGVEALLAVRRGLAEVASATHRIAGGQPEFLFYVARQTLRAALAGVVDADKILPVATSIATMAGQSSNARGQELQGDAELDEALTVARQRLERATAQASEAAALALVG